MSHSFVSLVSRLLDCADAGQAKPIVDQLVADLCNITGVDLHPDFFLDEHASITAQGKAVSPTTAAQCAEDVERTRVFMQGVHNALQQKLARQEKKSKSGQLPVRVLYAGTGPFALLLVPLLPLFIEQPLRVTLLDIHPQSIEFLRRLLQTLELNESELVESIVCANACSWQAPHYYDVIISETMRQGLLQEPQVSIFAHLQQFLQPDGWLIPQKICLDLWVLRSDVIEKKTEHLKRIFQLDKTTSKQIGNGDTSVLQGHVSIPESSGYWQDLKLTTEICVFDNYVLRENQSQLTLPLYEKNARIEPGSLLHYRYEQGEYPRFVFAYERDPDAQALPLPDTLEQSSLGVYHLRRFWHKAQLQKLPSQLTRERLAQLPDNEWQLDRILLDKLGVGLEPAIEQVYHATSIAEFERWIEFNRGGTLEPLLVEQVNRALLDCLEKQNLLTDNISNLPLNDAQLSQWNEHGYVIIPGVLSPQETSAACEAIWTYLNMRADDSESWYKPAGEMKKIMVQLFTHPALEVARQSRTIRAIFQQLWQRENLVVTTDRVGFNPPETPYWQFPGPSIHWDVELQSPIPFGTQALIYLTDVAEHQGAFCCVPGFHKKFDQWLAQQPQGVDLQQQDWAQWPVKPIAANAGDLIIWHHALPHGSSPNRADFPRMVQYINMYAP